MVDQPRTITKPLSQNLPGTSRVIRLSASALLTLMVWTGVALPSMAWIKPEPPQSVNAALVYGMKNQKRSLAALLGDNWIEGENGALLNVYSPFMMLAAKAAKATNLSSNPSKSDLDEARKRFARDVMYYSDTKNRFMVKFAVAFYGGTPDFAKHYSARIIGVGRGREVELKPERQNLDQIADTITNGPSGSNYEAINAYYFYFADLLNLDQFKLILESSSGPPVEFSMHSEHLY